MKISEIYEKYTIPPNLQEHMYRVAAVASLVTDALSKEIPLDKNIVVSTCLLHDTGNIIKFDFSKEKLLQSDEIEHWKGVQQDFIAKYGTEEHIATEHIAKEVGAPEKVFDILSNIGSSRVHLTLESSDWYRKVCSYADFRVAPYGIVSVNERFDDVVKRYEGREHVLADIQKTEGKRKNCLLLEQQIQEKCSTQLSSINNETVAPISKKLFQYVIGA